MALVEKIVSGGQTGIDRAALDVAISMGIPCGGWCPKGRRSEDGQIPSCYPLKETTSKDYRKRTEMNVMDSDGTLILSEGPPSGGTALTAKFAEKHGKPLLVIDMLQGHVHAKQEIRSWIRTHSIGTLNVAGPRESKCPGIQKRGAGFLRRILCSED